MASQIVLCVIYQVKYACNAKMDTGLKMAYVLVRNLDIVQCINYVIFVEIPVEEDDGDDFGIAAIIGMIIAIIAAVTLSILAIAAIVDILLRRWKHNKRVYMIR